jgi:hypothetical protein
MKRLLLLILLVMMVAFVIRSRHAAIQERDRPATVEDTRRALARARHNLQEALNKNRHEAHRAVAQAHIEARKALNEARETLDDAHQEVRVAFQEAAQEIREAVDGIPVPIVPGTRVDEAVAQPPRAPDSPAECLAEAPSPPQPPATPSFPGLAQRRAVPQPPAATASAAAPSMTVAGSHTPAEVRVVPGLISITEDRARDEARKKLESFVGDWLEADGVPRTWAPPHKLIDDMILDMPVAKVTKDDDALFEGYETLYNAEVRADVSPQRKAGFLRAYQHQLVQQRMVLLGATLAFVLTCLLAISGYIRTDEMTKGYYTNKLRLLAAAGVGAAGVLIFRMVA